jgi:hypothetical protein
MSYFLFHQTYSETGKFYIAENETIREEKLQTKEWFSSLKDANDSLNKEKIEIPTTVKRGRPSGNTSTKNSK